MQSSQKTIRYKRSRFSTRLPHEYLYTHSHFWLQRQEEENLWKIGFTKFAVRMLGEIVEQGFEVEPGATIEVGQIIGWVEGFKALTDLFGVIDGTFIQANALLDESCDKIYHQPYGDGWLYMAKGKPEASSVDVNGYMVFLDGTIDDMTS